MERNIIGVTLSSLLTLIVLVIFIELGNSIPIENFYIDTIVQFLNNNILTIIVFILFFFLGEFFSLFAFPIKLPGPVLFAYGGYFLTSFIFQLFYLIEGLMKIEVFSQLKILDPIICLLVFFIISIIGLAKIFTIRHRELKCVTPQPENEKEIEWSDVGKQLKQASFNIAKKISNASKPAEKKKLKKDTQKKKIAEKSK